MGCRAGKSDRVEAWLNSFPRLPLDEAIALEAVRLRQRHGLKIPDAIILATARCADLNLASRHGPISRSRWAVCVIPTSSEGMARPRLARDSQAKAAILRLMLRPEPFLAASLEPVFTQKNWGFLAQQGRKNLL